MLAVNCPNCVTPWKCNGPHLVEEDEGGWYSCEFGNFYKIFEGRNYWEFKPNETALSKENLIEILEIIKYLERQNERQN